MSILNKKEDYYWTQNIDGLSVDGGVMTKRDNNSQIRGEDIIFLLESNKQFQNAFNGCKFLGRDDYGNLYANPKLFQISCFNDEKINFNYSLSANQISSIYKQQLNELSVRGLSCDEYVKRPATTEDYVKNGHIAITQLQPKYLEWWDGSQIGISANQLFDVLPPMKDESYIDNIYISSDSLLDRRVVQTLLRNQQKLQSPVLWVRSEEVQFFGQPMSEAKFNTWDSINLQVLFGQMTKSGIAQRLNVQHANLSMRLIDNYWSTIFRQPTCGGDGWLLAPSIQIFKAPRVGDLPEGMYHTHYKVYIYGSVTWQKWTHLLERSSPSDYWHEVSESYDSAGSRFLYYVGDCRFEEGMFIEGGYEGKRIIDGCMQKMNRQFDTWTEPSASATSFTAFYEHAYIDHAYVYVVADLSQLKWWE